MAVEPANLFCEGCGDKYPVLKRKASSEAEQEDRQERVALAQFTQEQLNAIKSRKYVSLRHFQKKQPWDELDEKVFAIEDNSRIVTKQAEHKQPSIETEDDFWSALFQFFKVEAYLIPALAQSNLEALTLFRSWKTHWRYTMNYIEKLRHERSGQLTSLATIDSIIFFAECVIPTTTRAAQASTAQASEQSFTVSKICIQKQLCIAFNSGTCDEEDHHKLPSGKEVKHRCAKCLSDHPVIDCDKITFEELRFNPKR